MRFKDVVNYGLVKVVSVVFWIIVLKVYAVSLDPEQFGLFSIGFAVATYVSVAATGCQCAALSRFFYEQKASWLVGGIFYSPRMYLPGFLAVIISVLFLLKIEGMDFFHISLILILGLCYGMNQLVSSYLRISMRSFTYLSVHFFQHLIVVLLTIWWMDFGWVSLLYSYCCVYVATILCLSVFVYGRKPDLFSVRGNYGNGRVYFSYGFPIVLIGIFSQLLSTSDLLMLEYYGFSEEVGLYSSNYSVAEKAVFSMLAVMVSAFVPVLYKEHQSDLKSTVKIGRGALLFLAMSLPLVIVLYCYSELISVLFLHAEYSSGHYIIPIISVAGVFAGIAGFYAERLTLRKRAGTLAVLYGIALIANIAVNWGFMTNFGINAAVASTVFAYFLLMVLIVVTGVFLARGDDYIGKAAQ